MHRIYEEIEKIKPISEFWSNKCREHWDNLTKPLNSLGHLETIISRIGAIEEREDVTLEGTVCVAMCGDNGVIEEGVTQSDNDITALVAEHLAEGISNVNLMGKLSHTDVITVDMGIAREVHHPNIWNYRVANGTENFTKGPAMTMEQCTRAVENGIEIAYRLNDMGYRIVALGEMGIGNTTTSTAITSVFLGVPPIEITGPGAGLSKEGIRRKINAIERGIAYNHPDPEKPMEVLASLGGYDIAGLVGLMIGCAVLKMPVILDGFISYASALTAVRLAPSVHPYLIGSHMSSEPASQMMVRALGVTPVICADMSLGEGTGAVALFPLLETALAVYRMNLTFADSGMDAYEHFEDGE